MINGGGDEMKPLLTNRALYRNLASRVFAATSAAARVHPSLLGVKTANVSHPSLLLSSPGGESGTSRRAPLHTTTATFSTEAVLEDVKKNPFFDKYKSKIKEKSIDDDDVIARKIFEARQKFAEEEPEEVKLVREKLAILEEQSQKAADAPVKLSKKDRPALDDIVKVELFADKSADEISHIWLEYHRKVVGGGSSRQAAAGSNVISAVAPPAVLAAMMRQAAKNPRFLYAVPRGPGNGVEFVLAQWKKTDCYFTPLIQFQTHGENAPVALTIHHFDELLETKNVVLVRGEFDPNVFSAVEAQYLSVQMQLYYGEKAKPSKQRLLHRFNHEPKDFVHIDLVAELDAI